MSELFDENNDVDFEEESTTTRRSSGASLDKAVANADDIPLFANANKRGLNTAAYLKITKLDQPKAGFKGDIPLNSTLNTISQLYGNGIYNIELCNGQHKVLRSMENVRISIDEPDVESSSNGNGVTSDSMHIAALIKSQHISNERNTERALRLAEAGGKDAKELALAHTALVTTTTESAAAREREHMAGVNKSQQDFFGNMMLMQANMFQQTMAMLTAGHNQTMESLRATNERDAQQNNPLVMMQILREGIALGKDTDGEDREPWERAITSGSEALGNLLKLKEGSPPALPVKTLPNPSTPVTNATTQPIKKKAAFTEGEAKELLELKQVLVKRGIDLEQMLSQSKVHYAEVPDNELFGDDDNSDTLEGQANGATDETSKDNVVD